jgi:DNA-binding NarL/FixJ family response regulator
LGTDAADVLVVVCDLRDAEQLKLLVQLHPRAVQLPVVALHHTVEISLIVFACQRGIQGHGAQEHAACTLRSGLTAVHDKGIWLCARIAAALSTRYLHLSDQQSDAAADLLTLVAAGASNEEIATTLAIAPKTVDYRLRQLYKEVGVRNKHELAAWWSHAMVADVAV